MFFIYGIVVFFSDLITKSHNTHLCHTLSPAPPVRADPHGWCVACAVSCTPRAGRRARRCRGRRPTGASTRTTRTRAHTRNLAICPVKTSSTRVGMYTRMVRHWGQLRRYCVHYYLPVYKVYCRLIKHSTSGYLDKISLSLVRYHLRVNSHWNPLLVKFVNFDSVYNVNKETRITALTFCMITIQIFASLASNEKTRLFHTTSGTRGRTRRAPPPNGRRHMIFLCPKR